MNPCNEAVKCHPLADNNFSHQNSYLWVQYCLQIASTYPFYFQNNQAKLDMYITPLDGYAGIFYCEASFDKV